MTNKKRMIISFGILFGTVVATSIVTLATLKATGNWLPTRIYTDRTKAQLDEYIKINIDNKDQGEKPTSIDKYVIKKDGEDEDISEFFELTVENDLLIFTSSNLKFENSRITILIRENDEVVATDEIPIVERHVYVFLYGVSLSDDIKNYNIFINDEAKNDDWEIDKNESTKERIVLTSVYDENYKDSIVKISVNNVKKGSSELDFPYPKKQETQKIKDNKNNK